MAMIHLARDGAKLGSFSTQEVQEGLRTGKFLATDLAWEEGMPDWRPLGEVMAGKPTTAAPPPSSPAPGAIAVSITSSTADVPVSGLPWEHRQQLGFFKAFFSTANMVLTQPASAFSGMKKEGDFASPLLYGLIGVSVGSIVTILFRIALSSMTSRYDMFGLGPVQGCGSIIAVPIAAVLGMFVWGGILHVCLMMLGGAQKPFETTFRVVCFSSGSTQLLSLIPICGWFIAPLWNFVVQCIGLANAHEIDSGKAVLAVLLPAILCCGAIFLLATLVGGLGALSQGLHH